MTGTRTWPTHLSALEAAVAGARAALHDPAAEETVVLDDLALQASAPQGPPHAADAERAAAVLADLRVLLHELEVAHGRVGRELHLHRRLAAGRAPDTGAVYLDSRC